LNLHARYQREFGYRPGDFPVAEAECGRSVSLPIFPGMQEAEIERVIEAVVEIVEGATRGTAAPGSANRFLRATHAKVG